jgi:MFS family permease
MTDQNEPVAENQPVQPEVEVVNKESSADAHIGINIDMEKKSKKHKDRDRAFFPILLILIGVILLIQNLGFGLEHFNWWALFIFLPVAGALSGAWSDFRKSGRINGKVLSGIGSALVIGTVGVLLLVGANWGNWWPVMLIAAGLSSVLGGFGYWDPSEHKNLAAWAGFNAWTGLSVLLLGVGFLVQFLPIPSMTGFIDGWRWWAAPILLAAFGAFFTATIACWRNEWKMNWTVWGMVTVGVVVGVVGLFALAGLSWNLLAPVILIGVGLVVLSRIMLKK